jgi:uncharacterized membrane protein YeiH
MSVLDLFAIVGTIAFAAAGALAGIQKKLDVFGVFVAALVTAVGGGIVRDVFSGIIPPTAFIYPMFTIISLLTAVVACFCYRWLNKFNDTILILDAIGLGAFTAAGANMAFTYEYNRLLMTVMMAVLSGVGGGMLRDIFVGNIPFVFRKEVYAVASIIGAVCFFYTKQFYAGSAPMYVCFLMTVSIRIFCMRYDLHLPVIGESKKNKSNSSYGV